MKDEEAQPGECGSLEDDEASMAGVSLPDDVAARVAQLEQGGPQDGAEHP
jgi:hypothetical protein